MYSGPTLLEMSGKRLSGAGDQRPRLLRATPEWSRLDDNNPLHRLRRRQFSVGASRIGRDLKGLSTLSSKHASDNNMVKRCDAVRIENSEKPSSLKQGSLLQVTWLFAFT